MHTPRYDRRTATDENEAIPRFELEQTWRDGAVGVARAIEMGVLQNFRGPGGIEYCKKRTLKWGRDQGVSTLARIAKAAIQIHKQQTKHAKQTRQNEID